MHGLKTKSIIAAKRAARAARAAKPAEAPEPIDPIKSTLDVLMRMWEDLDGPHWLWRAHKLAERRQHDMDEHAYDYEQKIRSAKRSGYTTVHTYRAYVPWSKADSRFLRDLLGPKKPVVQDTVVTDIKRYVKSPAKTGGTRCDPVYEWKVYFFGGGGGTGPAMFVKSIIKIVNMPTPQDLINWLNTILPRLECGELQARIQDIESRHGRPQGITAPSTVQELMREDARVANVQSSYARVNQPSFRNNLESNVDDLRMPKRRS